jgi:hypothetical protein
VGVERLFARREVSVDRPEALAGAVDALRAREIDVVVVRGAFPASQAAAVCRALERPDPDLRWVPFPSFEGLEDPPRLICRDLLTVPLDEAAYFEDAGRFRRLCERLFEGGPGFEARVEALFGAMSGGRPVAIPRSDAGAPYTPATIRVLPPGHRIDLHCGLDFIRRARGAPVHALVDYHLQLSYFALLQAPASGGELVLYDLPWSLEVVASGEIEGVPVGLAAAFADSEVVELGAGDLLLFNGGRIYHRVTEVGPGPRRITIGGFAALSKDHRTFHYWN